MKCLGSISAVAPDFRTTLSEVKRVKAVKEGKEKSRPCGF